MADKPLTDDVLELLGTVSTNTLAGLMIQMYGMRSRAVADVSPINRDCASFVGRAYTVRFVPLREDYGDRASMVNPKNRLHGTFDTIPAGSVLMFDMRGDRSCGGFGDVLVAGLYARGVRGLVTDGSMRDGAAIREMKLPVFCNGIAPAPIGRSLYTAGVQEVIGCGGVMVEPGDAVVGDADGVVVVPAALAAEVARKGAEKDKVEIWVRDQIEKGAPVTGLYPPTDDVVEKYRQALAAGKAG